MGQGRGQVAVQGGATALAAFLYRLGGEQSALWVVAVALALGWLWWRGHMRSWRIRLLTAVCF